MQAGRGSGKCEAKDGEALFAWERDEREAGEVLGRLRVDDDAVGGLWVGPHHCMRLPWITAAIVI